MCKHKTLIQIQLQKVRTTKGTIEVSALVHEKMSPPTQVAEDRDYQMQYVQGYTLRSCTLHKPHYIVAASCSCWSDCPDPTCTRG